MEELKNYLLENLDELKNIVGEINSWDGSLDYLEYYENDEEFFNMFFEGKQPMEIARATYYGNYNFMDDYVHFNAYGNLDSCSEYEYEEELKGYIDEIIDRLTEEQNNLYLDSEIKELLENIESEEI